MYKIIVAGSRGFDDYKLLEKKLTHFLFGKYASDIEIVSGTAKGADKLGERFAREKGCYIKQFPADWEEYGKRAGVIRNQKMAQYADALLLFYDGKSKGSAHMKKFAEKEGLNIKVVYYEDEYS